MSILTHRDDQVLIQGGPAGVNAARRMAEATTADDPKNAMREALRLRYEDGGSRRRVAAAMALFSIITSRSILSRFHASSTES